MWNIVSSRLASTTWPTPEWSATIVANAAASPVTSSVSAIGGGSGWPSGLPLSATRPDIASAIVANPARDAYGPSWPNPEIRVMTSFGLRARRTSGPSPSRSSVPGREFSTNTSASSSKLSNVAMSSASLMSSTTVRLLRLTSFHHSPSPSRGSRHAMLRRLSPSGRSTLMTSAPKSAR